MTFNKSIEIFGNRELPFYTDCLVYKEYNQLLFKIIGLYNTGLAERLFPNENHKLNNDERQILNRFHSNYKELNEWIGELDSNKFDIKN